MPTYRWRRLGVLVGAALTIGAMACHLGGDTPTGTNNNACVGAITARIDGSPWSGSATNGVAYDGQTFSITGSDSAGRSILLVISGITSAGGTFSLDTSTTAHAAYSSSASAVWATGVVTGTTGTIQVQTVQSARGAGSFSFTPLPVPTLPGNQANGTVTVTDGVFDLSC